MNDTAAVTRPPFRAVKFTPRAVAAERRADGTIVLRNPRPLGPFERNIVAYLRRWSAEAPDRVFLAERRADRSWRRVSYGEFREMVDRAAQALLNRGLGQTKPLMILSGNSIDHAVLTFAGMTVGVPVAPVSVAYSLVSQDHAKLRYVFDLVEPKLVFVQNGRQFERALRALDLAGVEVVVGADPASDLPATSLQELLATNAGPDVDRAYEATGPDTVAKYLFTSGSTGMPKAVINTQRMLCANMQMASHSIEGDPDEPPVVLDWMPWNHTMAGNYGIHNVLRLGGTYHIDAGRPIPGQFEETIANLYEVSPTSFGSAPIGFAMLASKLEQDPELCRRFFQKVKLLAYGGASLPQEVWQKMQDLAVRTIGERLAFVTGWGSTETAPTATSLNWYVEGSGIIGLPFPGVELKMIPVGDRFELRLRGPIVFPGYHKRPDLTAAAFDEEGFYKIGDAGRFVDPDRPEEGLRFAGRVVEDFKLTSGTFVHVGTLRLAAIDAVTPLVQDAVITGQDRDYIGLLAWPNLAACRAAFGRAADLPASDIVALPALRARVKEGIARHNAQATGSAQRIARVILMAEPPSIDGNEITDKGYVNQRATLDRRAALVTRLYADPPAPDVIVI
ncbi:AMP-binding protein [Desertibaculum subflavum]|uniref:AMP-binding protein n=1 Tax=Desertibaculum subflavum TaxID=2268458 RepID=UPI000E674226